MQACDSLTPFTCKTKGADVVTHCLSHTLQHHVRGVSFYISISKLPASVSLALSLSPPTPNLNIVTCFIFVVWENQGQAPNLAKTAASSTFHGRVPETTKETAQW